MPEDGFSYRCNNCGGLFDFTESWTFEPGSVDPAQPGMWKYRHTFGLPDSAAPVSLGEGGTPLVWADVLGRRVGFKCEYLNPTGSFKDRGSSLIASWLIARGAAAAVEDSSGNAGASFAAYAARSGIRARIFAPENASGPKRTQIEAYGAELIPIQGTRADVTEAAMQALDANTAYASHAYLPYNLPGYATAAYEIIEQVGGLPGAVIVPAGQGGLLLGLARGLEAYRRTMHIEKSPMMIGVQARACAPLWASFSHGQEGLALAAGDHPTLAEGVRVRYPLRGDAVLAAVRDSGGWFAAVDEETILPSLQKLARLGLYVEPTSALVWSALEEAVDRLPDPIILVLTGFGLKYGVK
jgi:threonine synthase